LLASVIDQIPDGVAYFEAGVELVTSNQRWSVLSFDAGC
tara:strand:+ start:1348 stop:1464 length:117 start_codon:yes stop_codon:yes gene_type:complete